VFAGRRDRAGGLECAYRLIEGEPALVRELRLPELAAEEMARRRIGAGIPAIPADLGSGDLPNEGALEDVALSYSKGCYLGQEVMARLKSMGQVRRRLWRVEGRGSAGPSQPAAVFAASRQVGELRSAVPVAGGWIGLAMVTLMHVGPGAGLSLSADGPVAMHLTETP
jgi:folate-binding protein YgfZ